MSSTFRFGAVFRHLFSRLRRSPADAPVDIAENQRLKAMTASADAALAAGRLETAQREYESVLQADPNDVYVIYQLATILQSRGQLTAAAAMCDRGLALQPEQVGMLNRRASIASDLGNHRESLVIYEKIRKIAPDFQSIDAKLADQYSYVGQGVEALAAFDRAIAADPDSARLQSDRLFVMNYFKLVDRQTLFDEHRKWGATHEARLAGARAQLTNDPDPHRKLRVGYVSADLRHHAVAFFIEGVLQHHDRQQFEIHCFDVSPYPEDAVTKRLQRSVDQWHRVGALTDAQIDERIRSVPIDILVDLSGHTAHNRLLVFARKPAPVQISWFGYMNTTGLSVIDYRITDAYMDPPGQSERYYTEKLFRIESMACFSPHPESPPVGELPVLASGTFTFASVNQWTKVSEEVKALWGSILRDAPRARLLTVVRGGELPAVQQEVVSQLVRYGARASQVVVCASRPIREFLALFAEVDVALDPFPYGGGTSSMHTIWMGVPIVTLEGESEMSRAASGIARAVGLDAWVARDADDYRQIALRAVDDPRALTPVRAALRERMRASPLTDAAKLTKNVERAYREMWHAFGSK
jgi:predicted O-linked N-acetylglucosamine transferase (SPINDLY family)